MQVDGDVIHRAVKRAAYDKLTRPLIVRRSGVLGHGNAIPVDYAGVVGGIIGAGPVMPVVVVVSVRRLQFVVVKVTEKGAIAVETEGQALIVFFWALHHCQINAAGRIPFGPKGDGEGLVGQVDFIPGVHLIAIPIKAQGIRADLTGHGFIVHVQIAHIPRVTTILEADPADTACTSRT